MTKSLTTKLIEEVLTKFDKNSVNYAILRNYENLFYDGLKDLDLLVDPKFEKQASSIIQNTSKNYAKIFYLTKNQQRTTVTVLLIDNNVFSFDLNRYITLNKSKMHKKIIGFGLKITLNDLDTIRITSNKSLLTFVTIKPKQETILLLNHVLIKKKDAYFEKVNSFLIKNNYEPLKNIADNNEILLKINEIFSESNIRVNRLRYFQNITAAVNYLIYKLISYRKSRVIYFSGPDGSGKSTSYLNTIDLFQKLKIKYFPLRGLQVGMQYYIFSRKRNRQKEKQTKNALSNVGRLGYSDLKRDRNTGKLSWKIRRIIGLSIGLIDINILGRFFIFSKRLMGYTVIVEESPVDIFVKRHRPQIKVLESIFVPLLPTANLSILCVASEYAIFERKPELEKSEIVDYYVRISDLYIKNKRLNKIELPTDIEIQKSNEILENALNKILN